MTLGSGGSAARLDWASAVRPLLIASGNTVSPAPDFCKLARSLCNARDELLQHADEHSAFYGSLVALSTHFLCSAVAQATLVEAPCLAAACGVLVDYLFNKLDLLGSGCPVTQAQLLALTRGLVQGCGCLQRSDVITLAARLKSAEMPSHIRGSFGADRSDDDSPAARQSTSPSSSRRRTASTSARVDPLAALLEQLSTPAERVPVASDASDVAAKAARTDPKFTFVSANTDALSQCGAAVTLLDLALQQPNLHACRRLFLNEFLSNNLLLSGDAVVEYLTAVDSTGDTLGAELDLVKDVLELPIFATAATERLAQSLWEAVFSSVVSAALATRRRASTDGDEAKALGADSTAAALCRTAVCDIFKMANALVSSHFVAQISDNFSALTTLTFASLVDHFISQCSNLSIVTVLAVDGFLTCVVSFLRSLSSDLSLKAERVDSLSLTSSYSASQRFALVNRRAAVLTLMIRTSSICAQQAVAALEPDARAAEEVAAAPPPPADTPQQQLSVTESEEPLLGNWLEELLSTVPAMVDEEMRVQAQSAAGVTRRRSTTTSDALLCAALRDSPPTASRLFALAELTLKTLHSNLFGGAAHSDAALVALREALACGAVEPLAQLSRSLDAAPAGRAAALAAEWRALVHTLLVTRCLDGAAQDQLADSLLGHSFTGHTWPLSISRRVLSVVGQILFLRLNREGDGAKAETEDLVVSVWQRFLAALRQVVIQPLQIDGDSVAIGEDANVEHMQLLLGLFHLLNHSRKQDVLVLVCQNLIAISKRMDDDASLFCIGTGPQISRLLLLLDYLIWNFYEPSQDLLNHMKTNLFDSPLPETEAFIRFAEAEGGSPLAASALFELRNVSSEVGLPAKLDGLAVKCLLSSANVKYFELYEALVKLLRVRIANDETPPQIRAFVRYARLLTWRLLGALPVSVLFLEDRLPAGQELVHWLRVGGRFKLAPVVAATRDAIVKQGVSEAAADAVLERCTERMFTSASLMHVCRAYLEELASRSILDGGDDWRLLQLERATSRADWSTALSLDDLITLSMVFAFCRVHFSDAQSSTVFSESAAEAVDFLRVLHRIADCLHAMSKAQLSERMRTAGGDAIDSVHLSHLWMCLPAAKVEVGCAPAAEFVSSVQPAEMAATLAQHTADRLPTLSAFVASTISLKANGALPDGEACLAQVQKAMFDDNSQRLLIENAVHFALNSSEALLVDFVSAMLTCEPAERSLSAEQVDSLLTPHVFSPSLKPAVAERVRSALCERRSNAAVNEHFIAAVFTALSAAPAGDGISLAPVFCQMLVDNLNSGDRRNVLRFWETYLTSVDGRDAIPTLLRRFRDGDEQLATADWIALTATVMDAVVRSGKSPAQMLGEELGSTSDPTEDDGSAEVVKELYLQPLLCEDGLLVGWAKSMRTNLSLSRHLLEAALRFLRAEALRAESVTAPEEDWPADFGNALFAVVVEHGGLCTLPTEQPLLGGAALVRSDRWHYSEMALVPATSSSAADSAASSIGVTSSPYDLHFQTVLMLAANLANLRGGEHHATLYRTLKARLNDCVERLTAPDATAQFEGDAAVAPNYRLLADLDSAVAILAYMCQLTNALTPPSVASASANESDDEDSVEQLSLSDALFASFKSFGKGAVSVDESDVDDQAELDSSVCTFTVSKKEFMNQHWYHCHTCGFVDGEGVCTVCAKVCHRGHDMAYSKFGAFFCDCGAGQRQPCQALSKRSKPFSADSLAREGRAQAHAAAVSDKRLSCRSMSISDFTRSLGINADQMSADAKDVLRAELSSGEQANLAQFLLTLLARVGPVLTKGMEQRSSHVALRRRRAALDRLHATLASMPTDEARILVTHSFSSQNRSDAFAFDGVRLNAGGEQSQPLRQLLHAAAFARTPVCMLPNEALLVVCHDRAKLTIAQCKALLSARASDEQARLFLGRTAVENLSSTCVSVSAGEGGLVAVCGVKDCHLFSVAASGAVVERAALQSSRETSSNAVIKAVWCPTVRGLLALVTNDFVDVFATADDCRTPKHRFQLSMGKLVDACFATFRVNGRSATYLLCVSTLGFVYQQVLDDDCAYMAGGNPFFVTSTVRLEHPQLDDVGATVGGGGAAIFYSHSVQLLFVSYLQGGAFAVPFKEVKETAADVTLLPPYKRADDGKAEALLSFSDLAAHPGVVLATTATSCTPLLFYFGPQAVHCQPIVAAPPVAFVGCCLASHAGQLRVVALCEDGGLQVFGERPARPLDHLLVEPNVDRASPAASRPRAAAADATRRAVERSPLMPADFFEICEPLADVEFGGSDLLRYYDTRQIKNRLSTNGQYIACPKAGHIRIMRISRKMFQRPSFVLSVNCRDETKQVCGVRIELGKLSIERAPSFIEILGKRREVRLTRSRYFDIPFARNESAAANAGLSITFGACMDGGMTVVDTVQVYGKAKEQGADASEAAQPSGAAPADAKSRAAAAQSNTAAAAVAASPRPPEALLIAVLNALETYFGAFDNGSSDRPKSAVDVATGVLCADVHPAAVASAARTLRLLFANRDDFYLHRDRFLLSFALRSLPNAVAESDAGLLASLLAIARRVAVKRPKNLIAFDVANHSGDTKNPLLVQLVSSFWQIARQFTTTTDEATQSTVTVKFDRIVGHLVDIVHAYFVADAVEPSFVAETYSQLLLTVNYEISQSCVASLTRVFRPNRVPTPAPSFVPSQRGAVTEEAEHTAAIPAAVEESRSMDGSEADVDVEPAAVSFGQVDDAAEQLLAAGAADGDSLDMIDDEDDDDDGDAEEDESAMVELAIALSLQQGGGSANDAPPLPPPPLPHADAQQADAALLSDTTASGLSEDECSNAATDGSTLRASPVLDECQISEKPESDESVASVGSVSGPSSTAGEEREARSEEAKARADALQVLLLDALVTHLPTGDDVEGGLQAVAFYQTLLLLVESVNTADEYGRGRNLLTRLVQSVIGKLTFGKEAAELARSRTAAGELLLLNLRFLSVLLSKAKSHERSSTDEFLARQVASSLLDFGAVDFCYFVLSELLPSWDASAVESPSDDAVRLPSRMDGGQRAAVNLSPFFLAQYVREHSTDVFDCYSHLLTEMALRLPYQMCKVMNSVRAALQSFWEELLCKMVSCQQVPFVRRQARKLLLIIAGSKDDYRFARDRYSILSDIGEIRKLAEENGLELGDDAVVLQCRRQRAALSHGALSDVSEDESSQMVRLKSIYDVANARPYNWVRLCARSDTEDHALLFLLRFACIAPDAVSQTPLDAALVALSPTDRDRRRRPAARKAPTQPRTAATLEAAPLKKSAAGVDAFVCSLAQTLVDAPFRPVLVCLLRRFLLQCNMASRRWLAHGFVELLFESVETEQRVALLGVLWTELWPLAVWHGAKTSQLVDLLGYYTVLLRPTDELLRTATSLLADFRQQTDRLQRHPNANLYNTLGAFLECDDGYYLEDNPCLVCNIPEVPMQTLKLSSVKLDSRSTTTAQIVKMSSSHEISRIAIKLSDVKRAKMVKRLSVHYCNKAVSSAVELKNKPELWVLGKTQSLNAGQTDVKVDFAVPIVACNLMIQFNDFYETQKTSSEVLHCPRCSATVQAAPGVCANCGENVFQCHKCRSINYDERDPFLCNSCGFSKYAKFEMTFLGRAVASVDAIGSEDDRKRAEGLLDGLLLKAGAVRRQLRAYRARLEGAVAYLGGQSALPPLADAGAAVGVASVSNLLISTSGTALPCTTINRGILEMTVRYWRDCKYAFDELSKTVQNMLALRRELLAYDERLGTAQQAIVERGNVDCYGCATAQTLHILHLIRATASLPAVRTRLFSERPLLLEFMSRMRHVPKKFLWRIQAFLCELSTNSVAITNIVCSAISGKVKSALRSDMGTTFLGSLVQEELCLLRMSFAIDDSLWERRLRCAFELFIASATVNSTSAAESVMLPSLELIRSLMAATAVEPKTAANTTMDNCLSHFRRWLANSPQAEYDRWKSLRISAAAFAPDAADRRQVYLESKYGGIWLRQHGRRRALREEARPFERALFCTNSVYTRAAAAAVLKLVAASSRERSRLLVDLLVPYALVGALGSARRPLCRRIPSLSTLNEVADEFVALLKELLADDQWKNYLAVRRQLPHIADLLLTEVEHLHEVEGRSSRTDLTVGYAAQVYADLLKEFLSVEHIRRRWKAELLAKVLHAYLGLRRLVFLRTKFVEDSETTLHTVLEDLTTGTEAEAVEFMGICIDTVGKYPLTDVRTPVFIFERLCSIIFPEEKAIGEFLINIEKDSAQEDFLQGRMMGNPYSSKDAGMGPLMKDVKNRICRDCELVALLDDDTGMELLVDGKIVSLDLAVADVYRKLWQPQHNGEALHVVYRMRGLLGDATEEFLSSLDDKNEASVDDEQLYRLAKVVGERGGLQVALERLSAVQNTTQGRSLVVVVLKLLGYCMKIEANRSKLNQLGAVAHLLTVMERMLAAADDGLRVLAADVIGLIQSLLRQANAAGEQCFEEFYARCGLPRQIDWLLSLTESEQAASSAPIHEHLATIVPNLTLGSDERMSAFIDHFKPSLDFNRYDYESQSTPLLVKRMELFCRMAAEIQTSRFGAVLKQRLLDAGIVADAVQYLKMHHPPLFSATTTIDSAEWKEFLARPALKFVLRILTGLCRCHAPTQEFVASADCIAIVHRLERVSTEERLGSLAENLMEALRENALVAKRIEQVRQETLLKKKQLAMAMREKQLVQMGMKSGAAGKISVDMPKLGDTAGADAAAEDEASDLVCSICREGYVCQPQKVLAMYTFSKRVLADDLDGRPRKTVAFSPVTHFILVHFDCHQAAVKSARNRDEWESAKLHNANTKCNGLLPLWGVTVPESNFASCLSKFNQDLQQATGIGEASFSSNVHALKLLLLRFVDGKSFSEDTGGGGRESNAQLVPALAQIALYVLNAGGQADAESRRLRDWLDAPAADWLRAAYVADGPFYFAVAAVLLLPRDAWQQSRLVVLRRLLLASVARSLAVGAAADGNPIDAQKLPSMTAEQRQDFSLFRRAALFFGLVDCLYATLLKDTDACDQKSWPPQAQMCLRKLDLTAALETLNYFENELKPCESYAEFCDVAGLITAIPDPEEFLNHLIDAHS